MEITSFFFSSNYGAMKGNNVYNPIKIGHFTPPIDSVLIKDIFSLRNTITLLDEKTSDLVSLIITKQIASIEIRKAYVTRNDEILTRYN